MVLATATGEARSRATRAESSSKSRSSTKSRASRTSRTSSRRSSQRGGGWQCCPCPLTALRRSSTAAPCRGGAGGQQDGGVWPAPAKFYCCRADLVAAMARDSARERTNNNESKVSNDDGVVADYEDEDDDLLDFDEVAEEALPDDTFREVFDRSHQHDPDERWKVAEPDLPYVENLPHQLDVGRAIVVEGAVLPDALGFAINLSCGAGESPDIAFHLNPRLDRGYVARNSRTKGRWGEEQGAALGGSPFKRGQEFLIHILVTATDFKVSVDRVHFCNFQFRMPLSKVCRLEIHGDIIVSSIQHTRLEVYPDRPLKSLPENVFTTIPTDHAVPWSQNIAEKENLFIGRFKPNLSFGMEITIKGRMKLLPQSFYINLQQGCYLWPHPVVHFHINPRFAAEDLEHFVIVNGWQRGAWGSEQRYNRCRFRPGEPFVIVIYVEDQRYRVTVNGLQQAAMSYRSPPSQVDTMVVRGDVFIHHVGIAKSGPPVERLPSPSSPSGSFFESFVHVPEEASVQATLSPVSSSSKSESSVPSQQSDSSRDEIQVSSNNCSPSASHQDDHPIISNENNASGQESNLATTSTYQVENAVCDKSGTTSETNEQVEEETAKDEKHVYFDEPINAPDTANPLPKAALSFIVMAVLYGGYILRK